MGFETVFYEGFDYPAGQDLYYQSGGNGFTSNWKQSYQNKYLGVQSSGWTYPNLQTTGLRAAYDDTCYGTCNVISSSGRDVPSQATGMLYLQFLANFGTQLSGGTPHLRLYDDSGLKLIIGGNTANKVNETNLTNDNSGNFTSHKPPLSSRAGSGIFFNGTIAQVLIYKRVPTAEEIQQNFNALKLNYGL
ncbi:hypothetical protein [Flavobacterium sp. Arc2]|uniref:hypothetical protein n=1 Tax=Flavobacterium sp. Arc2 TaxID=3046685 RepID=UPI00352FD21A